MKEWILNWIAEMILKSISDDRIEDLAHKVQAFLIPFMHEQKEALIARLKAKAAATDTELDDAVVRAVDVFLSSFIPKDAQCLVPRK